MKPLRLTDFLRNFMRQPLDRLFPVVLYDFGQVTSLVLYRQPPFQVELINVIAGGGFPVEHRHPNVDSYEVHFCGDTPLTVNGKPAKMRPMRRPSDVSRLLPPLYVARIKSTDWHGADNIKVGGSFFSVQEWLNGVEPSSVGFDWEGQPVSMQHERLLNERTSRAA